MLDSMVLHTHPHAAGAKKGGMSRVVDKSEHNDFLGKIKTLLESGRLRGFVTYDELNRALPPENHSSEQIEDTLALLRDMGIKVVE